MPFFVKNAFKDKVVGWCIVLGRRIQSWTNQFLVFSHAYKGSSEALCRNFNWPSDPQINYRGFEFGFAHFAFFCLDELGLHCMDYLFVWKCKRRCLENRYTVLFFRIFAQNITYIKWFVQSLFVDSYQSSWMLRRWSARINLPVSSMFSSVFTSELRVEEGRSNTAMFKLVEARSHFARSSISPVI